MYSFSRRSAALAFPVLDTGVAVVALVAALVLVSLPQSGVPLGSFLEMRITLKNVLLLFSLTFAWPMIFAAFGLYHLEELRSVGDEFSRIVKACTVGSAFAIVIALTSRSGAFGALSVVSFWLAAIAGTACARGAVRRAARSAGSLGAADASYAVIVGTGPRAVQLYREIVEHTADKVLGFIDVKPVSPFGDSGPPFLGTLDQLEGILASRAVDVVYIGLPVKSCYGLIEQVMRTCDRIGVLSSYKSDVFPRSVLRPQTGDVDLMVNRDVVANDARLWGKRLIDICGALASLLVLSPVLAAAALAIRLTSPGPIVFTQERFGFNRRRMRMYKFRTMVTDAEARQADLESQNEATGPVFKIRNDPRVTPVGRVLRRLSIDELPQLVNVLKGEMSLVGPRPLPIRDVSRFTEASLMRRFSVKPGLTCLWQISGRSNTGFDQWIEQDLNYIDRWSLWLDLKILLKTLPVVLKGSGAV